MTDAAKPTDNYRVRFGAPCARFSLEVYTEREAEVVKRTAEAALGVQADVKIERMVYAIYSKEAEGKPDGLWDYCLTKEDAEQLKGIVWKHTRFASKDYYWKYVTRETLEAPK